jgi:predicted HTH transcriptional regulator
MRSGEAFANTAGGTVVIGVDDGSKNVRGVPDSLEAEEKLANFVSDSIRPRLIPEIEVAPWRNLNILTVQVYPKQHTPPLSATAGTRRWRLHPRWFHESQSRCTSN